MRSLLLLLSLLFFIPQVNAGQRVIGDLTVSGNIDTALTSGRCVETTTDGVLTVSSAACGTLTGSLNSGRVPRATGSSTLADGAIRDDGSKIGINTAVSSTHELYVVGSGETTLSLENSGVRAVTMGIDGSSGNFTIAQSGALATSAYFTQTGAGLTGINEDSPNALLEINPGGLTLSGAPLLAVDSTTGGSAGDGDAFIITSTASNNNVGINSTTPGTRLDVQGVIRASSDIRVGAQSVCQEDGTNCPAGSGTNYWSLTAGAGNVGISTTNTVGIGTTMGSAGLSIMNGNVGIGTWNPIALLEVKGTVNATALVGPLTGNASTATALQNARTIGGTSFDGTSNIVPATITVADTTDSTSSIALFESATGDLAPKTDGGITYNASTGALSATSFTGAGTGLTGTASSLTAGTVTTNANLTGPITSTGNATAVASQTGTGTTFVMQATPTLTTPVIGAATGTSLALSGNIGVGGAGVATNPLQVTGRAGVTQNIGIGTTFGQHALSVMSGNVGIGTWNPEGVLQTVGSGNFGIGTTNVTYGFVNIDAGTSTGQLRIDGDTGACLMLQDTDNAGWTECDALNGTLTCSLDVDGICD